MNKKQLKELEDIVIHHCFNCGTNKLFYGYQRDSITIVDGSKCCDNPDYSIWSHYHGVDRCEDCRKETVWFNICYKCGKVICDDCTDYHYVETESGLMDFCNKCHDSIKYLDIIKADDEIYEEVKFSEWKRYLT